MDCPKCGGVLPESAKFCHHCGYAFAEDTALIPNQTPTNQKKSKKTLVIGICAGAIALIVLVAVLLGCFVSGPEAKILQAMGNSLQAYRSALSHLPLPEHKDAPSPAHYSAAITLEQLSSLPMAEGIGTTMELDADATGRLLDLTITPNLGSASFLETNLRLEGTDLYVAIPDLFGNRIYSADTTKFAQTLRKLNVEMDEDMANLGFDIFEVLQILHYAGKPNASALGKAAAELGKALRAEKLGKEMLSINGAEKKCERYLLTIPQKPFTDFLDVLTTDPSQDVTEQLSKAIGIPVSDDITDDEVIDVIKKLGDLQLDIAICDGYIARISSDAFYEDDYMGISLCLDAQFGGKGNYEDDLSLQFTAGEDVRIQITSSGDHACRSGSFTNTTVLLAEGKCLLESQFSYTPNKDADSFAWTVTVDGTTLQTAGQVHMETDGFSAQLDQVSIRNGEEDILTLSMQLSKSAYTQPAPISGDILNLTTASAEQLETEAKALGEQLFVWLLRFLSENSQLSDFIGSLL